MPTHNSCLSFELCGCRFAAFGVGRHGAELGQESGQLQNSEMDSSGFIKFFRDCKVSRDYFGSLCWCVCLLRFHRLVVVWLIGLTLDELNRESD